MKIDLRRLTALSLFGALMVAGDLALEALPNVHLVGVFITVATVLFRAQALWSVYLYVLLIGLIQGFGLWWIPYLYVWALLWGTVMLVPRRLKTSVRHALYVLICFLHGLLFGVLYAPAQALLFGFTFQQTLAWIASGLMFDLAHAVGNFFGSLVLVPPLIALCEKLNLPRRP